METTRDVFPLVFQRIDLVWIFNSNINTKPDVVAYSSNPSAWEVEAGGPAAQGLPEFRRSWLKNLKDGLER